MTSVGSIRALADRLQATMNPSPSPPAGLQVPHSQHTGIPLPRSQPQQIQPAGTTVMYPFAQGSVPIVLDASQLAAYGVLPASVQTVGQNPGAALYQLPHGMAVYDPQQQQWLQLPSNHSIPALGGNMSSSSVASGSVGNAGATTAQYAAPQPRASREGTPTSAPQQDFPTNRRASQSSQHHTASAATSHTHNNGVKRNTRELAIATLHKKVLGRLIIVGDVHGCPEQLRDLARTLKYDPVLDVLIIAGDLVNKGPDSQGAVRAAMELGALAVVGNHDITVLELVEQIEAKAIDPFARKHSRDPAIRVAREMTDDCVRYLRSLPHVIKIPQYHLMVLHAGVNLSYPLEEQSIQDLTHLRRLQWNPEKEKYDSIAKGNHGTLWAKLYQGPELIVFGHDARTGLQEEPHAIGLDTGCVYGGSLTAVVFPGRRLVSVPGLPKDKRLGADEDFDEANARLDTPAREPSPTPPSIQDAASRESTPSVPLVSSSSDTFPMAPSVQQLFYKHKILQQQQQHQQPTHPLPRSAAAAAAAATVAAASAAVAVVGQPAAAKAPSAAGSAGGGAHVMTSMQGGADAIGFLRSLVGTQQQDGGPTDAGSASRKAFHAQGIRDDGTPSTVHAESPPCRSPTARHSDTRDVQMETLLLLMQGDHCEAVLALLRHDLYKSVWDLSLAGEAAESQRFMFSFWSVFVEMCLRYLAMHTVVNDELLELMELLMEVLHEKQKDLRPAAVQQLSAAVARLDAGEVKGFPKGILKAMKLALRSSAPAAV